VCPIVHLPLGELHKYKHPRDAAAAHNNNNNNNKQSTAKGANANWAIDGAVDVLWRDNVVYTTTVVVGGREG
jgi:hypothetical protein